MSPKVDSANVGGATARSAWSRDVRQDAVGVTYSRRSYYYDREFSDSIVARSSDDNYVDDLLRDDLVRPFVPFKQRGPTLQYNAALANEDLFTRGRVLQCASSDDGGGTGKGKKPVRDTLEVKRGEMHNSIPVVQTLPAVPLISRLAASQSGYVNGQVVGDESEDGTSNLTLAGIDVKTIAQGIRFFVRVVDAYQRQQGDNVGGGETADDDDDDEEGGEILGWDLDPYHLEAGPPRRHWKRASPNRSSSTRNTQRRALSRCSARSGTLEEAQGHASNCADEATSRPLLPPLSASRRVCYYLIGAAVFGIVASFGIAVWWARSQGDASAGFTIGGYFIAVDALIVAIAGIVHRAGCRCWKS